MDRLEQAAREFLPSGSGFDSGTTLDVDGSSASRLRFRTSFHHMDESGGYDGWTDHGVDVRVTGLDGVDVRVTGRDRNAIKEYIADTFHHALRAPVALIPVPGGPARVVPVPVLSVHDVADSSASLWEAVLEIRAGHVGLPVPPMVDAINDSFATQGTASVRDAIAGLAPACHMGWTEAARRGYDSPFDWEFCPAFVLSALDWEPGTLPALRSDWLEQCRAIVDTSTKVGGIQ